MPAGLPAAVTLTKPITATSLCQSRKITVQAGETLIIEHPGADQDGWDEEWICQLHGHSLKVAVRDEDLRNQSHV